MAKMKSGALGHFSGALGNIVGSTYNGKGIVRMKPAQVTDRKTVAQEAQRMRFGLVQEFLKTIRPFVEIGYSRTARGMSAVNAATSELLKNATTGTYPDIGLSFADVLVAKGGLTSPRDVTGEILASGELEVRWADNSDRGSARPDDVPMVLVYNAQQKEMISSLNGGSRADAGIQVALPADYQGQEVHVWLAFKKAAGSECSDSVYAGLFTV